MDLKNAQATTQGQGGSQAPQIPFNYSQVNKLERQCYALAPAFAGIISGPIDVGLSALVKLRPQHRTLAASHTLRKGFGEWPLDVVIHGFSGSFLAGVFGPLGYILVC